MSLGENLIGYPIAVPLLVFVIALLYSSVGHGGATGYLAVLSFFALPPAQMSTTALLLNVLVSGVALFSYTRAGHLSASLTWPFLISSIPAAFAGSVLRVSDRLYFVLLAVCLLVAAFRLAWPKWRSSSNSSVRPLTLKISLPAGAAMGALSGIVGIGGGVFLSPLLILMRWADAKKTSATAAAFVLINSVAGLAGRFADGKLDAGGLGALPVVALAGGWIGSHWGANRLSNRSLRILLAMVLLIAAIRLAVEHL